MNLPTYKYKYMRPPPLPLLFSTDYPKQNNMPPLLTQLLATPLWARPYQAQAASERTGTRDTFPLLLPFKSR
jgi:hypothetical protein